MIVVTLSDVISVLVVMFSREAAQAPAEIAQLVCLSFYILEVLLKWGGCSSHIQNSRRSLLFEWPSLKKKRSSRARAHRVSGPCFGVGVGVGVGGVDVGVVGVIRESEKSVLKKQKF